MDGSGFHWATNPSTGTRFDVKASIHGLTDLRTNHLFKTWTTPDRHSCFTVYLAKPRFSFHELSKVRRFLHIWSLLKKSKSRGLIDLSWVMFLSSDYASTPLHFGDFVDFNFIVVICLPWFLVCIFWFLFLKILIEVASKFLFLYQIKKGNLVLNSLDYAAKTILMNESLLGFKL